MSTGLDVFDASIQKTNRFFSNVEKLLGWNEQRRNQTYKILRVILHGFRDRMTTEAVVNFSAQLPLILKGVYFESYNAANKPEKYEKNTFLSNVQKEILYDVDYSMPELVRAIVMTFTDNFSDESVNVLEKSLPNEYHDLIK